jgi:hypothetical protein
MTRGTSAGAQAQHPATLDAVAVWRQQEIPVVFWDTAGKRLLVKMPYAKGNYAWLKGEHVRRPEWLKQFTCWRVPRAWIVRCVRRRAGMRKAWSVCALAWGRITGKEKGVVPGISSQRLALCSGDQGTMPAGC